MHFEGRRKCLHCEKFFLPDARNRRGQRYCRKRACRKASKAESQRRWLKQAQNRDYFTGPENAARVRAWQAAHPDYWKERRKRGGRVLQDLLIGQDAGQQGEARQDGAGVLQDHWQRQSPVVIGLIAHLAGTVLQEDIASMTGRLIAKGQALMGQKPSDDSEKNLVRGAAAAGAARL
jgi:hypothetical protein